MGLIGKLGQGVGVAMEYNEHRKALKARHAQAQRSQSDSESSAGPSNPRASFPRDEKSEKRMLAPEDAEKRALYDDHEDSDSSECDTDQAAWQLDEAFSNNEAPPSYEEDQRLQALSPGERDQTLARDVLSLQTSNANFTRQPLPYPVILPQKRPGSKQRGFVRAYAPLLGSCGGISEKTFLAFLDAFRKSAQASPIFTVVMISAGIAGFAPGLIAMAVTTGVQIAAQVGAEVDSRRKTNLFLDRMNRELFVPAGFYAMIVKYKPDSAMAGSLGGLLGRFGVATAQVDINAEQSIAKNWDTAASGMSGAMRKLRMGDGTTHGSAAMPEAAPLIFPDIDHALMRTSGVDGKETFKDKARDAGSFLTDYIDRRKQMQYARDNPGDALAIMPPEQTGFRSAYADPNHPMYSGGLLSLVSGGAISRERRDGRGRRSRSSDGRRGGGGGLIRGAISAAQNRGQSGDRYGDSRYADDRDMYYDDRRGYGGSQWRDGRRQYGGRGKRGKGGVIGRFMSEDVLYLTIVNMPSEEELENARRALARG